MPNWCNNNLTVTSDDSCVRGWCGGVAVVECESGFGVERGG